MPQHSATRAVRAGIDCDSAFGAVTPPLHLSSNFSFAGLDGKRRYDYTRSGNPTRDLLAGALADLEALSGHAVVLEDDVLMELWRVPEPAGAAVCVPISGPSSVLGTLWLFCHAPRKFSATETNLAEILAGRLAADLDREALIAQLQAKRQSTAFS